MANSVLSIYLIHDNIIIRSFLWQKILLIVNLNSFGFIFVMLLICIIIFFTSILFDIIFKLILSKPINLLSEFLELKLKAL